MLREPCGLSGVLGSLGWDHLILLWLITELMLALVISSYIYCVFHCVLGSMLHLKGLIDRSKVAFVLKVLPDRQVVGIKAG